MQYMYSFWFSFVFQCEGQLAWEVVPKTKLSLNVSLPDNKVYQFAVSANTQTSSSGMVWATCTILPDKRIGKLKTVNVDVVKKRSMKVSWKLDCSDRIGVVTGYQAVFCKVKSAENHECIGNPSVEETTEDHLTITNLEPFTFYKVSNPSINASVFSITKCIVFSSKLTCLTSLIVTHIPKKPLPLLKKPT